jgi:hypothetical protein
VTFTVPGTLAYPFSATFDGGQAVVAISPSPSPSAPFQNDDDGDSRGAGSIAFLVILVLIVASVLLFWAMNRSLKRARRNLGGDPLPRRSNYRDRPTIPIREDPIREDPIREDDPSA